ncbi:MAG: molybdopterin-binding protein, partial [Myxococcota bacterium]
ESNSFMLEALAHRDGAEPILHPIVRDDMAAMRTAMVDSGADLLVLSGGSSVGREDFAPVVAHEIGQVAFHGIALKPGSSTGIGRIGSTWVVLGPGYPVAAFTAWELIVRPLVFALLGTADRWPYQTRRGQMAAPYKKRQGRTEIARVAIKEGDPPLITPLPGGSALLSTLTQADGFLRLDDDVGPLAVGDDVLVHLIYRVGSRLKAYESLQLGRNSGWNGRHWHVRHRNAEIRVDGHSNAVAQEGTKFRRLQY